MPLEQTRGIVETRGARVGGSRVYAVRLPGYVIAAEIIFGLPGQRLTLRLDAGSGVGPYVDGALLAIRDVGKLVGLQRGLDTVLD